MPLNPQTGAGQKQRIPLGFGRLSAEVGDHIGQFYERAEERANTVVAFVKAGLDAGDKCVCIMNTDPEQELEAGLAAAGVQADKVKASGQLVVSPGEDDPEKMKALLASTLSEIPGRFPFLRWVGEMTWSLGKMPTTEKLMEWESHCNTVEDAPAIFLCQYDLTAFHGTVVMDAMKTHPTCIVGNTIHQNPFYQDAEEFLQELREKPSTTLA